MDELKKTVDETTAKDSTVRLDANAIVFKSRELSFKVLLELGEVIERNKLSYEDGARYLKQAAQDVELAAMRASFKMPQAERCTHDQFARGEHLTTKSLDREAKSIAGD